MAEAKIAIANKPAWVELSSTDPAASREFYSKLFGWTIDVSPDPQYGGYGMAKIEGEDVAGIAPQQMPGGPSAWMVYIGAENAEEMAKRVQAAGGTVVAPPLTVGDQGTMAVFQDPTGAFISAWQANQMRNWRSGGPNAFGWAELNARGIDKARPFTARCLVGPVSKSRWEMTGPFTPSSSSTASGWRAGWRWSPRSRPRSPVIGASTSTSRTLMVRPGRRSMPAPGRSRNRWTSAAAASRSSRIRRVPPSACSS